MTDAFLSCDSRRLTVPEGTARIPAEAFAERDDLEEVILPRGLRSIGPGAFADCPKLCRAVLPDTLQTIEDGAFLDCGALREILLPESLREIGAMAFQESGLRTVCVPAGVERIGEEAFFSCADLRHADVLGASTRIGDNAFGADYALQSGYIAPGYPPEQTPAAELLYTLLWCSCPQRHSEVTTRRAEEAVRRSRQAVMERILKTSNAPALRTILQRGLLQDAHIESYLRQSLDNGQPELTALLLSHRTTASEEDFTL